MDELIDQLATKHETSSDLVRDLLQYEKTKVHMDRRRGAKDELRRMIEKHLEENSQ